MISQQDACRPGPLGVAETTRQVMRAGASVLPLAPGGEGLRAHPLFSSTGKFEVPDEFKPDWQRSDVTTQMVAVGGPAYYPVVIAGTPRAAARVAAAAPAQGASHRAAVAVDAAFVQKARTPGPFAFTGQTKTMMAALHDLK